MKQPPLTVPKNMRIEISCHRFIPAVLSILALALAPSAEAPAATVIENELLRAEVSAEKGAALISLVQRADGASLLSAASATDALLLPDRQRVSLSDAVFQSGPATTGRAEFSCAPSAFPKLKIVKRYELPAGVAALRISYELTNEGAEPVEFCLATRVALFASGEEVRVSVPTSMGAVTYPANTAVLPLGGSTRRHLHDLDGAWAAVLGDGGKGAVAAIETRHLSALYVDGPARAFEFLRTVVKIAPREVFRTEGWIAPVQGFDRVTGAAAEWVGGLTVTPPQADGGPPLKHLEQAERLHQAASDAEAAAAGLSLGEGQAGDATADAPADEMDEAIKAEEAPPVYTAGTSEQLSEDAGGRGGPALRLALTVQSARACQSKAVWRFRPLSGETWTEFGRDPVELEPGRYGKLNRAFRPRFRGSYVVRVDLHADGKTQASFEQPVVAGVATGLYRVRPPARDGKVLEGFRPSLWAPSAEVVKPHLALAKPLSGRPVRMLFASPTLASRGLVELQHRMDLAADYAPASASFELDGRGLRAHANETLRLRALLGKPHDVIVLAQVRADYFPIDLIDEIFRQTREEGTGLVLMRCANLLGIFDPLLARSGVADDDEEDAPQRRPDFPGMVTASFGKGRVAVVEGEPEHARPDWYGQSEDEVQGLIQAILWAARRDAEPALDQEQLPRVTWERDRLAATPYSLVFRNGGAAAFRGAVRAHVRRNLLADYSAIYHGGNEMAYRPNATWEDAAPALEAGLEAAAQSEAKVDFKLPALAAGAYHLDLQVLDDRQTVVGFYRLPLRVISPARIASAELATEPPGRTLRIKFPESSRERPWFVSRAGDTLKLTLGIKDAGRAVRARLQAFDPWARMPFDQTVPIRKEGDGMAVADFVQPLHSCIHMISVLKMSLLDGDGESLSEERLANFITPRADRRPAFELRGYAEVRVNNAVSGYDMRVTIALIPFALAWHGVQVSEWGGVMGGAKILGAGDKVLNTAPEAPKVALSEGGEPEEEAAAERIVGMVDDGLGFDEPRIDRRQAYFRIPCFNNPEHRREVLKEIKESYEKNSACYPFKGFIADEFWYAREYDATNTTSFFRRPFVPDRDLTICRCKHCAAAFIAYARRLFNKDLSRLNAAWSTEFEEWEEVEIPLTVAEGQKPPPASMWPYVLAHRDFIEEQMVGLVSDIVRVVKAVAPECESGLSGLWKTGLHTGIDVYRMARLVKYNFLYADIDMWSDFGDSDAVPWVGYASKYGAFMGSHTVWNALASGQTGIGYYGKEDNPMHRPDFTFHDEPAHLFRAVRELKDAGLDRLVVRHCTRDPIALYYCSRDVSLAQLEDWNENPQGYVRGMKNGGRGYHELVYSVAIGYRGLCGARYLRPFWTAAAQLEEGGFGDRFGVPKLLLLPYAQCLSAKQAETIRKFVREGGVVVGDVHTGWRDGQGQLRDRGALDDVFGIARRGEYRMRQRRDAKGARVPITFGKEFGEPFSMTFEAVGPGDVEPAGARPLASFALNGREQPAFLVNDFGKGRAIYLNFLPAGYAAVEVSGEGEEQETKVIKGRAGEHFQRLMGRILEAAQVRQPLGLTGEQRLTVGRFGEADATHVVFVAGRSAEAIEAPYRVKIPEKRHVYSARRREYLGFTEEFPVHLSVEPRRIGDIYSLLPYRVEGLAVELPTRSVKAGERLPFTVKVLPAEAQRRRHVIAARVLDPKGRDPVWYRFSMETVNGAATGTIDTAASDPAGTWTLILTDAASGVREQVTFDVLAP